MVGTVEIETWTVTELNTRQDKFDDEFKEILYGDPYTTHEFETKEEAETFQAKLKAQGVTTNLAHTFRTVSR